jgi:hypothetical protein
LAHEVSGKFENLYTAAWRRFSIVARRRYAERRACIQVRKSFLQTLPQPGLVEALHVAISPRPRFEPTSEHRVVQKIHHRPRPVRR